MLRITKIGREREFPVEVSKEVADALEHALEFGVNLSRSSMQAETEVLVVRWVPGVEPYTTEVEYCELMATSTDRDPDDILGELFETAEPGIVTEETWNALTAVIVEARRKEA